MKKRPDFSNYGLIAKKKIMKKWAMTWKILKNGKGLDEGTKAGTKKISLEKEFIIKLKKVVRQRFP